MKLFTKMLVTVVLVTPFLSSCYSSKILNKEDSPITRDLLSKIEPGRDMSSR